MKVLGEKDESFKRKMYEIWGFWANVWQQEWRCHFLGFIVSGQLCSVTNWHPHQSMLFAPRNNNKEWQVTSLEFLRRLQWHPLTHFGVLFNGIPATHWPVGASALLLLCTLFPQLPHHSSSPQVCWFQNHSSQFWKILMLIIFGGLLGVISV